MIRAALALLVVAAAAPAAAQVLEERLDHRDQPSLTLAPVFEHLLVDRTGEPTLSENGLLLEAGWGFPLTDEGGEGLVGLRAGASVAGDGDARLAPFARYRGYFGDEAWKTFFDAGVRVHVLPVWGAGVRLGFGVQHDPTENLGFFAGAGAGLGYGEGLIASADVLAGVQLRFGVPGEGF